MTHAKTEPYKRADHLDLKDSVVLSIITWLTLIQSLKDADILNLQRETQKKKNYCLKGVWT